MSDQHDHDLDSQSPLGEPNEYLEHDEQQRRLDRMLRPRADARGGRRGDDGWGWDGEGPDHFTELERRLIVNLRVCQGRMSGAELRIGRLVDALEGVLDVLEELVARLGEMWGVMGAHEVLLKGREALRLESEE